MSLIIETGVGIRGANSYLNEAYVSSYLTLRNRQSDWSAADPEVQEAAIIASTDYVEKRFYGRWKGIPRFEFQPISAKATLTFNGLPTNGQTLTLGDDVYTFVSVLSGAAWEVLIGANPAEAASNAEAAVNAVAGAGVQYGLGTPQSRHAAAASAGAVLTLTSLAAGAGGNLSVLQGPLANVVISGFSGGLDGGQQSLSWPRQGAFDDRGGQIIGIPDKLKQAIAEYAIRALDGELLPDPVTDDSGARINRKREQVGPIQEEYRYDLGSFGTALFRAYPAADRLLRPLLLGSGGGVIRG